jgi:septal ring factor EnvC (AmiA/AmiB activator)
MTKTAISEILIRGNQSGEVQGAHVKYLEPDGTDRNGNPRFYETPALPLHLAEVADAFADGFYATGTQFMRMEAEIAALKLKAKQLTDKSSADDAEIAALKAGSSQLTEKLAAADEEIAALKAEIEALKAPAAQDDPAPVL